MPKHVPLRRCVGCGRERAKPELIRLVAHEGQVLVDYHAKLPGRGAYVCPQRNCIEQAMKKRRLERAFKLLGDERLHYADLPGQIRQAIEHQILHLLGLSARAGKLVSGWNNMKHNLHRIKIILIAADAAENTKRRFTRAPIAAKTFIALSKRELGAALGKPERSVIGITDERLATELARELERYCAVQGE